MAQLLLSGSYAVWTDNKMVSRKGRARGTKKGGPTLARNELCRYNQGSLSEKYHCVCNPTWIRRNHLCSTLEFNSIVKSKVTSRYWTLCICTYLKRIVQCQDTLFGSLLQLVPLRLYWCHVTSDQVRSRFRWYKFIYFKIISRRFICYCYGGHGPESQTGFVFNSHCSVTLVSM